ncbi:unnamed protein product, partial [Ilex paraguariensis]
LAKSYDWPILELWSAWDPTVWLISSNNYFGFRMKAIIDEGNVIHIEWLVLWSSSNELESSILVYIEQSNTAFIPSMDLLRDFEEIVSKCVEGVKYFAER